MARPTMCAQSRTSNWPAMTGDGRQAGASHSAARLAILGFGRIGRRLAMRLADTPGAPDLVAVLARPQGREAAAALVGPDVVCTSIEEVIARTPAVAVECASAATLAALGPGLLAAGIDLLPLSLGAFGDEAVEARLTAAARAGPGRIEVPAGAVGSLGFLVAGREGGLDRVIFRAAYPVARWRGMGAGRLIDLEAVREPTTFFRGSVREAACLFPGHLNVSVGVAIAGLGLDRTEAELVADPRIEQATFEVEAFARPGPVTLRVGGRDAPVEEDPIDYTTFSVMRLLARRQARIAI